jgi:putative multiple sugar transport system substrate-binding protein
MQRIGKIAAAGLVFLLTAGFLSAGGNSAKSGGGKKASIGIAMPTRSSQRWISDGESVKAGLEALGYTGDLQFGDDVIENQVAQIENMITKGVKALVIASIDGESLTAALEKAHAAKIPVIAYDRLIRNSPYVDYYVSFDNYKVGRQMGDIMVKGLNLAAATPDNPKYIEVFGGSPDDNNAYFFYNGAMDVLKPYLDSGAVVIGSGQQGMNVVGTLRWDGAAAQSRMDNLLSGYYTSRTIDGVLSPYDGISLGILSSLKGVGYGAPGKPMPIVGGQDAELPSIKSILAGEQYATIFKDTRSLASATIDILKAILEGKPAQVNNTTDYENGSTKDGKKYIVPSMLLQSTIIYKDNARSALVDQAQYYKASELGL